MTIIRTASTAVLGSALVASLLIGSGGTASAKPIWCEPAASYACARWAAETKQVQGPEATPAGFTRAQHLKLLSIR